MNRSVRDELLSVKMRISVLGGGRALYRRAGPRAMLLSAIDPELPRDVFLNVERAPAWGGGGALATTNVSRWSSSDLSELLSTGAFTNPEVATFGPADRRNAWLASRSDLLRSPSATLNVSFSTTNDVNVFYADLWAFQLAGTSPGASAARGVPVASGNAWLLKRAGLTIDVNTPILVSTPGALLVTPTTLVWTFSGAPIISLWGTGLPPHRFTVVTSTTSLALPPGRLLPGYVYSVDADAQLLVGWGDFGPLGAVSASWPLTTPTQSSTMSSSITPSPSPTVTSTSLSGGGNNVDASTTGVPPQARARRALLDDAINRARDRELMTLYIPSDSTLSEAAGAYGPLLYVHAPPTSGGVTVIPSSGRMLLDTFTSETGGWISPDAGVLFSTPPAIDVVSAWVRVSLPSPPQLQVVDFTEALFSLHFTTYCVAAGAALSRPAWYTVLSLLLSPITDESGWCALVSTSLDAMSVAVSTTSSPAYYLPPDSLQLLVRSLSIESLTALGVVTPILNVGVGLNWGSAVALQLLLGNVSLTALSGTTLSQRQPVGQVAQFLLSEVNDIVPVANFVIDDVGAVNVAAVVIHVSAIPVELVTGNGAIDLVASTVTKVNNGLTSLLQNPFMSVQLISYALSIANTSMQSTTITAAGRQSLTNSISSTATAALNILTSLAIVDGRTDVIPNSDGLLTYLPPSNVKNDLVRAAGIATPSLGNVVDDTTFSQVAVMLNQIIALGSVSSSPASGGGNFALYTPTFTQTMLDCTKLITALASSSSPGRSLLPPDASGALLSGLSLLADSNMSTSFSVRSAIVSTTFMLGQTMLRSSAAGDPQVAYTSTPDACDGGRGLSVSAQHISTTTNMGGSGSTSAALSFDPPTSCSSGEAPSGIVPFDALVRAYPRLSDFIIVFRQWSLGLSPSTASLSAIVFDSSTSVIGIALDINGSLIVPPAEGEDWRRQRRLLAKDKTDIFSVALAQRASSNPSVLLYDLIPNRPLTSRVVGLSLHVSSNQPTSPLPVTNASVIVTVPLVNATDMLEGGVFNLHLGYEQMAPLSVIITCPSQTSVNNINGQVRVRYDPFYTLPAEAPLIPSARIKSDDVVVFETSHYVIADSSLVTSRFMRTVLNWGSLYSTSAYKPTNASATQALISDTISTTGRIFMIGVYCGPILGEVSLSCGPGYSDSELRFTCPAIQADPRCVWYNSSAEMSVWSTQGCSVVGIDSGSGAVTCQCSRFTDISAHYVALAAPVEADVYVRVTSIFDTARLPLDAPIGVLMALLVIALTLYLLAAAEDEAAGLRFSSVLNADVELNFLMKCDAARIEAARKVLGAASVALEAVKSGGDVSDKYDIATQKRVSADAKAAVAAARAAIKSMPSAPQLIDRRPLDGGLATRLRLFMIKSKAAHGVPSSQQRSQKALPHIGEAEAAAGLDLVEKRLISRGLDAPTVAKALAYAGVKVDVSGLATTTTASQQRKPKAKFYDEEEEHDDEVVSSSGSLVMRLALARVRALMRFASPFTEPFTGLYLAFGRTTALLLISASLSMHIFLAIQFFSMTVTSQLLPWREFTKISPSWLLSAVFVGAMIAMPGAVFDTLLHRVAVQAERQAYKWRFPIVAGEFTRRQVFEAALSSVPTSDIIERLKIGERIDDEADVAAAAAAVKNDSTTAQDEKDLRRRKALKRQRRLASGMSSAKVAPDSTTTMSDEHYSSDEGIDNTNDNPHSVVNSNPSHEKIGGTPAWETAARNAMAKVDAAVIKSLAEARFCSVDLCARPRRGTGGKQRRTVVHGLPCGTTFGILAMTLFILLLIGYAWTALLLYYFYRGINAIAQVFIATLCGLIFTHAVMIPLSILIQVIYSTVLCPPRRANADDDAEDIDSRGGERSFEDDVDGSLPTSAPVAHTPSSYPTTGSLTERLRGFTLLHAQAEASGLPSRAIFVGKIDTLGALTAALREDVADSRERVLLQFYAVLRLGGWRASYNILMPGVPWRGSNTNANTAAIPPLSQSTTMTPGRGYRTTPSVTTTTTTPLPLDDEVGKPSSAALPPSRTLKSREDLDAKLGDHNFSINSSRLASPRLGTTNPITTHPTSDVNDDVRPITGGGNGGYSDDGLSAIHTARLVNTMWAQRRAHYEKATSSSRLHTASTVMMEVSSASSASDNSSPRGWVAATAGDGSERGAGRLSGAGRASLALALPRGGNGGGVVPLPRGAPGGGLNFAHNNNNNYY